MLSTHPLVTSTVLALSVGVRENFHLFEESGVVLYTTTEP